MSGFGVGLGDSIGDALAVAVGDPVGLAVGSGAYVVSTLGVGDGDGLAAGDGLLVDLLPDVHVTEFPSAERVHTICELGALDVVGLGVGLTDGCTAGCTRTVVVERTGPSAEGPRVAGTRVVAAGAVVGFGTVVARLTVR